MTVTESGIEKDVIRVALNMPCGTIVRPLMETDCVSCVPEKMFPPNTVTDGGTATELSPDVAKAKFPMDVTVFGIDTERSVKHEWNALFGIAIVPLGITTDPDASGSIRHVPPIRTPRARKTRDVAIMVAHIPSISVLHTPFGVCGEGVEKKE